MLSRIEHGVVLTFPTGLVMPPLPEIDRTPPTIVIALPDGGQAQLPGVLWPSPHIWNLAARHHTRRSGPPVEIRQLTRTQSNVLTGAWHELGAETRRYSYTAFGLFVQGEPIAIATAGSTVSKSVEKSVGLDRGNTIELTRLARSPDPKAKGVLRAMLRLWRDFLAVPYWTFRPEIPKRALVTYSLPGKHGGQLYRFDGWQRLRACRPWHAPCGWQTGGSRCGTPEALWIYRLDNYDPPATTAVGRVA